MTKERAGKLEYSQAELEQQYRQAVKRGERATASTPQAVRATYDRKKKRIVIDLSNRAVFSFPAELLRELRDATPKQISNVTLSPQGTAVFWDEVDAQYSVAGLLDGIFGTKAWMSEIGRKGGASTSTAKSDASRRNGQKGGRPKAKRLTSISPKSSRRSPASAREKSVR
jgi:hypothetical protein